MRERRISCMFYKPNADDPLINRIVAFFRGPYCHVELSFEDGHASSIMGNETVFFEPKNYSNMNYTVVTILVPDTAYTRVQNFCRQAASENVEFCLASMLLAALPFQIMPKRKRATFCSRFVTEALQVGDCEAVSGLNPMTVTPTGLYNVMSNDPGRILDTVPGRLRREWCV